MLMITKITMQRVDYQINFEIICRIHVLNDPVGLDVAIDSSHRNSTDKYDYYVTKNTMLLPYIVIIYITIRGYCYQSGINKRLGAVYYNFMCHHHI